MFKVKYILIVMICNVGLLTATTLETSDQLGNLEIVLDSGCEKSNQNVTNEAASAENQRVVEIKAVETVNYTLKGCDGMISFPVTVRANKRQGE